MPFDRLYIFGDSFSDTGAGTPHAMGPTSVSYLAEHLELVLKPARVGQVAREDSVNFAASGAWSGFMAGMPLGLRRFGHGLVNQIGDFTDAVSADRLGFEPRTTLAFIAIGLNDGDLPSQASQTNLLGGISRLIAAGIVHIRIARLPEQIPDFRETARRLNPVIEQTVAMASAVHPASSIGLSDWGRYFDEVLLGAAAHGFTETETCCTGRAFGLDEDLVLQGDPDAYYYLTPGHPTTAVHRIVGRCLADELMPRHHFDG